MCGAFGNLVLKLRGGNLHGYVFASPGSELRIAGVSVDRRRLGGAFAFCGAVSAASAPEETRGNETRDCQDDCGNRQLGE